MHVKQAVFLVGGKGTRLGSLSRDTPKPLLEIDTNLRFIDVLLEEAARHGFTDLILLAGHLSDKVIAAYDGKIVYGAQVRVLVEPSPAGTGGALLWAKPVLDPWFLMANGDSQFDINLRAFATHVSDDVTARVALRRVDDPARYGAVQLKENKIIGFLEKNANLVGPTLINGGVYLMSRSVLSLIDGPCSLEQDIFPQLVEQGKLEGVEHEGYFLDMGLPETYATAQVEIPQRRRRPTVFLDRDGVLNHDAGYTHRVADLRWIDGAKQAIRAINDAGYLAIVVSNQAGIARGLYDDDAVMKFHAAMQDQLSEVGAHIDAFYFCPYHKDAQIDHYRAENHPDRKPNPGMLLRAMADWPIDGDKSFLIGDQATDIAAAQAAGIPGHLFDGGNLESTVMKLLDQGKHSR
jgi:D,D-heptose 1,7-bisphosphate phosphatase